MSKVSELSRDEIGGLLAIGPSGECKYMVDLGGIVESMCIAGQQVCRLMSDMAV
jgi:hypothetical protein